MENPIKAALDRVSELTEAESRALQIFLRDARSAVDFMGVLIVVFSLSWFWQPRVGESEWNVFARLCVFVVLSFSLAGADKTITGPLKMLQEKLRKGSRFSEELDEINRRQWLKSTASFVIYLIGIQFLFRVLDGAPLFLACLLFCLMLVFILKMINKEREVLMG